MKGLTAAWRLLTKATVTRGRILALSAIAGLLCLIAIAVRLEDSVNPMADAWGVIDVMGLAVIVPVVALVFAAAALGDPSEDGTLVYLWLRPVARWKLASAGLLATLTAAIPVAVGATVLAASFTGVGGKLVVAALVASLVGVCAYSSIFVALGLKVRRALAWGLAYVIIWEGAVSRVGTAPARLSVSVYTRSILARWVDQGLPVHAASTPVAIAVLLAVTVVGVGVTTFLLTRTDV